MVSGLDDMPVIHDHDRIRVADRGKPVRDDQAGAVLHELHHRVLDLLFRAGVDAGGRFVQDQDLRVGKEGPADGEQLPLALGKTGSCARQHRVVTVRQRRHHLVAVREPRRLDHPLVRNRGIRVLQVCPDRVREQDRILQDDPDAVPELVAGNIVNVHPVHRDLPGIDVVEAHEEVYDGGLSGAGGTDQGDLLPGLHLQVEIIDDLLPGHIAEIHMAELDHSVARRHRLRPAPVLALLIQDREDPLRACDRRLDLAEQLCKLVDGTGELLGIDDEGGDHAYGDHSPKGKPCAEGCHDDKGAVVQHVHDRPHGVADNVRDDPRAGQFISRPVKFRDGLLLQIVGRHGPAGRHLLLDDAVEGAEECLPLQVILPHQGGHDPGRRHGKDHRGAGQKRQRHAEQKHDDHGADQRQDAGEHGGQRLADDVGDIFRVIRHAAHDIAVGVGVQIRDRQTDDLCEQFLPHPPHHVPGKLRREVALQKGRRGMDHIEEDHGGKHRRDPVKVPADEAVDGPGL